MTAHDPIEADTAATALAVVGQFEAGRFDDAYARFSPQLRDLAPAATVAELWRGRLGGGEILSRGPVALRARADGLVTATVPVRNETGGMDVVMSVDPKGILHGLRFAAAPGDEWKIPSYASRRKFAEHEVTILAGDDAVPGTVTLPRGWAHLRAWARRGAPAVVLLAGGGPFDRDETAGPNKPLKDLAWGLATRGIAVLRFDKPTSVHAEKFNERGFTLADEYVPYAAAAVRILQTFNIVDRDRIFVLGHSAGGKVAPRVAQTEPLIAGLILLAGDAAPMHEAAVRVARHVAALDPGPQAEAALAQLTEQAASAADPELDPLTPASQLPFGLPAAYWRDLHGYDPVGTAAAVGKPMFIAQGGRDYQVTAEDDLALWQEGLRGRPDVVTRVYSADDHLFFPGSEPATPASYQRAQHVDRGLIEDIADWIRQGGRVRR